MVLVFSQCPTHVKIIKKFHHHLEQLRNIKKQRMATLHLFADCLDWLQESLASVRLVLAEVLAITAGVPILSQRFKPVQKGVGNDVEPPPALKNFS